jgi:hypothetical protein
MLTEVLFLDQLITSVELVNHFRCLEVILLCYYVVDVMFVIECLIFTLLQLTIFRSYLQSHDLISQSTFKSV